MFDPITGSIFITEDNFGFGSGFYRYDPPVDPRRAGRIEDGGTLWMLGVAGTPQANLSGRPGARHHVSGRLDPHRRSESAVPDGRWPAHDHEQPGDLERRQAGLGRRRRSVQPAGGAHLGQGRHLLHGHPGRGRPGDDRLGQLGRGAVPARLREGHRSGVGVPPPARRPGGRLPVGEPRTTCTCPTTSPPARVAR